MVAPRIQDDSFASSSPEPANLDLLLLKKRKLQLQMEMADDGKMDYDDASKSDVAAEVGRSFGRGGEYAAEFYGDIYDIGRAAVDGVIPGMDDRSVVDAINPFAPPDEGDIARQENLWDNITPITEEKIRRGGSDVLDFTKTAAEYALPTITGGPQGGLKKALQNALTTGAGAGTGEYIGGKLNETAGEVGEVIGALSGGVLSRAAINKGKVFFSKYFGTDTSEEIIEQALEVVMQQADDPAAARAAYLKALENGDEGTLADLMGDAGVYNVEALADKGTIAARGIEDASVARSGQMVGRIDDVMQQGDATEASVAAHQKYLADRARVNAAEQRRIAEAAAKKAAEEAAQAAAVKAAEAKLVADRARINAAQQRRSGQAGLTQSKEAVESAARQSGAVQAADAADAVVDASADVVNVAEDAALVRSPVSEQSAKLANTFDTVSDQRYQKDVKPLWDAFDAEPNVPIKNLAADIEKGLSSLDPAEQLPIRREFADELASIAEWGADASPKSMHRVVSLIKNKLRDVPEAKYHQTLVTSMNQTIERVLEKSKAGPAYVAARMAEKKFSDELRPSGVSKARRAANDGELLASKLAKNLEAGAVTGQQILDTKSPAIVKTFKDTMRALANRANDNGQLDNFLRNHDELLTQFPDLQIGLNNLKAAKDTLKVDQTAASVAGKTLESVTRKEQQVVDASQKTLAKSRAAAANIAEQGKTAARKPVATAKLPKASTEAAEIKAAKAIAKKGRVQLKARLLGQFKDKPKETIDGVLKSENAPAEIETLIKGMGESSKPHLTALIGERLIDTAIKSDTGAIDPKIVKQFESMKPALQKLMSPEEIKSIEEILGMTDSLAMRKGGSAPRNTILSRAQGMLASTIAALSMKVLPGNSLIMAGAARSFMKDLMLRNPDPAVMASLETMVKNPQRFEAAVRKYKPKDAKGMRAMLNAMMKDARGYATGVTTPPIMVKSGDEDTVYRE